MNIITQILDKEEIPLFSKLGMRDVIIAPKDLSFHGTLSKQKSIDLILNLKKAGINSHLQIDLLINESDFQNVLDSIDELPIKQIKRIRVKDIGLLKTLVKRYPFIKIHCLLEQYYRNYDSIDQIGKRFDPFIESLSFNPEVPGQAFLSWANKLLRESEICGLGHLMIFYSYRKLDTILKNNQLNIPHSISTKDWLLKSPFPIYFNQHGTQIHYPKDYSLMRHIEQLKQSKLRWFRVDRYIKHDFKIIETLHKLLKNPDDEILIKHVKDLWKTDLFHGFFKNNKTDLVFEKLKNQIRNARNQNYLAEVIESKTGEYIVLNIKQAFEENDQVYFITPLGKKINFQINSMRDTEGKMIHKAQRNDIIVIPFHKGITPLSYLYINESYH